MGWKAAIVSEPAASRGSSTGRTKAGQMAAGTAHARWGSAQRGRPSFPPAVHLQSLWTRTGLFVYEHKRFSSFLQHSALQAVAYVYCSQGLKAFVLLPFSSSE